METDLLIIGQGHLLALAAQASQDLIEHLVVGKTMELWRRNMPEGMFLRSACDWHLGPLNVHTIDAYLQSEGKTAVDVVPLSLKFYLSYAEWFQQQKNIQPLPFHVQRLDHTDDDFVATATDGERLHAHRVVLAPGFKHFPHIPTELRTKLPKGRFQHTCEFIDFSEAKDKRFLIIGGRQSAFEWAHYFRCWCSRSPSFTSTSKPCLRGVRVVMGGPVGRWYGGESELV